MPLSPLDRSLLLANASIIGIELNGKLAAEADAACAAYASAGTRLAVYGSLGPGRQNEHVMTRIGGVWREGFSIAGVLERRGWGAALGYPGATWAPGAAHIDVTVFESAALPNYWSELDLFEGDQYSRLFVSLWRDKIPAGVAFAYTLRDSSLATLRTLVAAEGAPDAR